MSFQVSQILRIFTISPTTSTISVILDLSVTTTTIVPFERVTSSCIRSIPRSLFFLELYSVKINIVPVLNNFFVVADALISFFLKFYPLLRFSSLYWKANLPSNRALIRYICRTLNGRTCGQNKNSQRILQNASGRKFDHITIIWLILFLVTRLNTKRDS